MATSTIFTGFNQAVENRSLILIMNDIKNGKYRTDIEHIRSCIASCETEKADQLKKKLPAFTPSGTYEGGRKSNLLKKYSGFVHLDFDKLSPEQLLEIKTGVAQIPYTFGCFRSPSGNGLKVLVEVNTTELHHDLAYRQVQLFYENILGILSDPKCKDITRLCFVSYDPELYKNLGNEQFLVQLPETAMEESIPKPSPPPASSLPPGEPEDLNNLFIFEQQIQFTNNKETYSDGNRNNYIYLLASNCNRAGLSEDTTLDLCSQHFSLPQKEIKQSVRSAYSNHSTEFAKFAKSANRANRAKSPNAQPSGQGQAITDEDPLEDYLKTTPTIPDEVYEALPELLKQGASAFTDKRKRDVFFTAAIAIISGCLPNVTGIYFQERVYPHLYTFIIAPAASGKGVLKNAKRLAEKYHQNILQQSRDAQKIYQNEMDDFKMMERNRKKGEPSTEKPEAPPFKILFIPADCSKARMIEHLKSNDGQGIICETEADSMSGAKQQDWGDYSVILRAAFHHETVSSTRKTDNQYDEINEPRLAVALSGTPSQAPRLLSSAEDGLFSRFLFYAYKNKAEWQDPSPRSNGIVYNDHFEALSLQVLEIISHLELSPTTVELTSAQWDIINTEFPLMLSDVVTFTSEEAVGVVYRLGLVLFRMCMIFTALRKYENGEISQSLFCTDKDFYTVLQLIQTYLEHSLLMFNNLPKQYEPMQFLSGDGKRRFFDALPQEFTRKEATEIGLRFKLAARTVDEVLRSATGISLTRIKAGHYQRK
ncbi:MAG: DUF3987 domain-containing protein [Bacteroidota bacterium]